MSASASSSPVENAGLPSRQLACRDRVVALDGMPKMVGILNVTEDSFSDGGRHLSPDAAVAGAEKMVGEGAAMVDVGGQSTRPGYVEISDEEEIARVVPVIERLVSRLPVPVSVDTYKAAVARAALRAGVQVLNDIHGFQGSGGLAGIAAEFGCGVILMHNDAGFKTGVGDAVERLKLFFGKSLALAEAAGVSRERIVLDPGIGFAKTHEQNLELLARLGELRELGLPLLLGASRKSVIGNVLSLPPGERLEGTLATTALAVWQRVEFIRVHDVSANLRAARVAAAIRNQVQP